MLINRRIVRELHAKRKTVRKPAHDRRRSMFCNLDEALRTLPPEFKKPNNLHSTVESPGNQYSS